jgi:hypothetical protein
MNKNYINIHNIHTNEIIVYNPWVNTNFIFPITHRYIDIIILNYNKDNEMKGIIFSYKKENETDLILITKYKSEENQNGYDYLKIKIENGIGKIDNINKSKSFTGSNYMNLAIKIFENLNVKKCYLDDFSTLKCNQRDFYIKLVPLNMITLLRFKETYYMKFGFLPYNNDNNNNNNNNKNKNKNKIYKNIMYLINNLYKISWNDIDDLFHLKNNLNVNRETTEKSMIAWNNYKEIFKNKEEYNTIDIIHSLEYLNVNKENNKNNKNKYSQFNFNYLNNINNINYTVSNTIDNSIANNQTHINISEIAVSHDINTPFSVFKYYHQNECSIFIDWLEVFHFTTFDYERINSRINMNIQKTSGLIYFNQLRELLKNVKWVKYF